jgi:hypothetical protein
MLLVAKQWTYTVDDSYVTFRYSEHLAKGWGLSFNQMPPRAEGYTSFLWTLIMAVPHVTGLPVILVAKILGVVFTIASLLISAVAVYSAEDDMPPRVRISGAAVASLLFLSFPFSATHAISGMETALATFFYATIVALSIVAIRNRSSRWVLPFCCFLLGLTRPEANLFCVILLGLTLVYLPRQARRNFMLSCVILYVVPGAIYFLWRYYYYGMLLPLPFYIKSGKFHLYGLESTLSFVSNIAFAFVFPVLLCIVFRPVRAIPIVAPAIAISSYLITVNHIMGFGDRYFYPLLPVLSVLGGIGIMNFAATLPAKLHLRARTAILLFLLLAVIFGFKKGNSDANASVSYARGLKRAHIVLGQALATATWHTADPVLVIGDAGAVPYISRLTTIDSFGINDPFIATHFPYDRSGYILSKHPAVIVFISNHPESFDSPLFYELPLYKSCLKSGYTHRATFPFAPDYYLWAMWNPNSQDATMLANVLGDASRRSYALFDEDKVTELTN